MNLSTFLWALGGTQFIFLMTALGAATVFFLRDFEPRFQAVLPGFAGGVMTAASFWSLLLPAIEQARAEGRTVIMIGDGINDSPALSAANVGVAIADGAAIAREIADVTISASDLRELIKLRRIATALMHRIHRNYRFVIGFNGSLIALGALGVLPPATSAMLHNGSTIAVSVQSMTNLI